jgi:hypothetical protein
MAALVVLLDFLAAVVAVFFVAVVVFLVAKIYPPKISLFHVIPDKFYHKNRLIAKIARRP